MAVYRQCEPEIPDSEAVELDNVEGVYCGMCAALVDSELRELRDKAFTLLGINK